MLCGTPTLRAEDTPAQAAARVALEQKLQELNSNPPTAPAPAPAVVNLPAMDTPAQAAARAALEQKLQDLNNNPPTAPATASAVVKTAPHNTDVKPLPAAAVAVPLSKEERLRWLLVRYKADEITPQEYYTQRAAILAEP